MNKFFRSTKAAIKLHTLLDLRGNIPTSIHISDGKPYDVNILLDALIPEAGAFYIMDWGYVDFARLHINPRSDINMRQPERVCVTSRQLSGSAKDQKIACIIPTMQGNGSTKSMRPVPTRAVTEITEDQ